MGENTFLGLIGQSMRNNWNRPAMTDYDGRTLSYKDFAQEIDKLHDYFHAAGIKKGDKISIAGKNSANWAIAFFGTLAYGAVAVSILHEFDKDSIQYIVDHSDSETLFVDEAIWEGLNKAAMPKLKSVFTLDKFALRKFENEDLEAFDHNSEAFFAEKYKNGFFVNDLFFRSDKSEELAVINYTSGTMNSPKGVMIPYRSLWSNTKFANDNLPFVTPGSNIVCMLPMAHTYGLAFEVLNSISMGCHIHFLGKSPSPKVLVETFARVKPRLILAVPLIIEKIVSKNVWPKISGGSVSVLRKIPGMNLIVNRKIRQSMMDIFGDEAVEIVIGGAALNPEVEKFLRQIRFPYTVGYGMTECGPLISYAFWMEFKERSCGRVVDRMQVKIDSTEPEREVGEIMAKGSNVMLGYYKNPEATAEVLDEEGWLHTGDLGVKDKDGFIFIKGRNKNMFLGASGQNIYPEEIEDKLNNVPCVAESLVIHEDGHKIVALIVPDVEVLEAQHVMPDQYESFFSDVIQEINAKLPAYSRISVVRIQKEEFEKTPKRSIRRFKYQ